ncbi:GNAT family N-acetyltransferase [uncultured Nevskia sp.]|uniref:GNAT family N-acetyltransferase n=1 Tax=uncultured Nevskia sp. TaxID=228950 RepID=UPI0025E8F6C8|nr:GNAT family N-acetyltransferase [uncultured Nevskia sp.]
MTQIIEITDSAGRIVAGEWLPQAEAVHRQLRPQLMPDYLGQMQRVFAGGAQMLVAVENGQVLGLTVWRILEKTFSRSELYIDDLVTDAGHRSSGVGKALLAWCEAKARDVGCTQLTLDSGTPRLKAHKFYFREGLQITSFHFVKTLDG